MKRFKCGLVVGKFSPLHRGHESLITQAIEICEQVLLLCYSNPEFSGCELSVRESWLRRIFPSCQILVLPAEACPRNDDSETVHRQFVVDHCRVSFKTQPDAVFANEDYGPGFAAYLSRSFGSEVQLVRPDLHRSRVPISGTKLRADVHSHRQYLAPEVYSHFVETVVFLGGESTGKSTLSRLAAELFQTVHVEEYGRTLWEEKRGQLTFDDMLLIARTHVEQEDRAREKANRFLFVDTSPLTTLFYSYELFGRADPELIQMAARLYSHVFLCEPDFPFVQDGTRQNDDFRLRQHHWYQKILTEAGVPFSLLGHSIETRLDFLRHKLEV